jgi:hypothetical protein
VESHKGGISSLCIYKQFVVTGSSDASVKIWTLTMGDESGTFTHWILADTNKLTKILVDELREVQVLPMSGNLPLSLATTSLPRSKGWLPVILHPPLLTVYQPSSLPLVEQIEPYGYGHNQRMSYVRYLLMVRRIIRRKL